MEVNVRALQIRQNAVEFVNSQNAGQSREGEKQECCKAESAP